MVSLMKKESIEYTVARPQKPLQKSLKASSHIVLIVV